MRSDNMPRPFAPDHSEGTTHGEGCHTWGPRHYECAMRELARLRAEVEGLRKDATIYRDANRVLVQWKGRIDQARIALRLPFPDDYDRSPLYAIATLVEASAGKAHPELLERAETAERERDELRRRIAEAVELLRLGDLNDSEALAIANNLNRLLDAEEGK